MTDFKPGDHFTVKVNGIDYDTVIDAHGTQRYVANPFVKAFVDASMDEFEKWMHSPERRAGEPAPFGLNDLDYRPGEQGTLDELIAFGALHGYSVSGLCDYDFMEGVEIFNPLWDDE